ncbi:hypothetical protein CNR22_14530 [Sphingobacteriaceae bacterium]|nr:hypothetical protein CNR22_14530 [Sphingobacteriaceae bacterium]
METRLTDFLKLALLVWIVYSCKKEYDYPPLKQVSESAQLSIQKLKSRLTGPISSYKFGSGDTNLYCTVIADELSGNLYQQVFVRDDAGSAIQLNLKESGGLYIGDKIRINLNYLYLISANSMIYLDSVDVAKNIVKLSSGNDVLPKHVTLDEVFSYSANPTNSAALQSQLIELTGLEFKTNTLVPTFADAIGKTSITQTLSACEAGKIVTLRTSGRSNFAGKPLPKGNGTIIAIVSQYNSTMQLLLRDYNEVNMNGAPCATPSTTLNAGTFMAKDFNDLSVTSGGWITYSVTNSSVNWFTATSSLTPSPYARISGYVSGNTNSENWLISPAINLASAKDPIVSFKTAAKFSGTVLDILVSTDYSSGNPASATWSAITGSCAISPTAGDYLWMASGYVPLNTFKSSGTRIAFRYKSTTAGATSYQLDDIVVKEK